MIACLFFTGITHLLYAVTILPEILINDTISSMNGDPAVRLDSIPIDTLVRLDSIQTDAPVRFDSLQTDTAFVNTEENVSFLFSDSTGKIVMAESKRRIKQYQLEEFKPNPKKAWIMAVAFPGAGQFYNRQYWKLPIVYGGFVGFMYAITWNNKNYQDYQQAYFDIVRDAAADPGAEHPESWGSWQDFFPGGDPASILRDTYRHTQLKNGKDFYRKYRDLSIILSVAFYAICVADAYVDAQMAEFNMSPDLSFRVTPELFPATFCNTRGFGINICLTF